jgi:small subunit ribosomal protein S1
VDNPREIIQPGDPVRVKILEIDSERRRLSLSIKRVEGQVLPVRPIEPPTGADSFDDVPELGLSEDVFASSDEPAAAADPAVFDPTEIAEGDVAVDPDADVAEAPAVPAEAPETPEASAEAPEASVDAPEASEASAEAPPEASVDAPEASEASVDAPEASVDAPEASAEAPEASAEASEAPEAGGEAAEPGDPAPDADTEASDA